VASSVGRAARSPCDGRVFAFRPSLRITLGTRPTRQSSTRANHRFGHPGPRDGTTAEIWFQLAWQPLNCYGGWESGLGVHQREASGRAKLVPHPTEQDRRMTELADLIGERRRRRVAVSGITALAARLLWAAFEHRRDDPAPGRGEADGRGGGTPKDEHMKGAVLAGSSASRLCGRSRKIVVG